MNQAYSRLSTTHGHITDCIMLTGKQQACGGGNGLNAHGVYHGVCVHAEIRVPIGSARYVRSIQTRPLVTGLSDGRKEFQND